MKVRHLILATAVIFMLGISVAAQDLHMLVANVPFDYRIDKQVMPAGQYRISQSMAPDFLLIKGTENQKIATKLAFPSGRKAGNTAKLVFARYGDTYFLREVWAPGANVTRVQVSKFEREFAAVSQQGERVAVLATSKAEVTPGR